MPFARFQSDKDPIAEPSEKLEPIQTEINRAKQALESYQRSLEIYRSLLNNSDAETRNAAKIEMQRLRKIVTALLQHAPTK